MLAARMLPDRLVLTAYRFWQVVATHTLDKHLPLSDRNPISSMQMNNYEVYRVRRDKRIVRWAPPKCAINARKIYPRASLKHNRCYGWCSSRARKTPVASIKEFQTYGCAPIPS